MLFSVSLHDDDNNSNGNTTHLHSLVCLQMPERVPHVNGVLDRRLVSADCTMYAACPGALHTATYKLSVSG